MTAFNAQPGLTQQSTDTNRHRLNKVNIPNANAYKLCSLIIHEIEIKRQVVYDKWSGQVHGFTHIGCGALMMSVSHKPQKY